jgi:hypothetical protein
MKWLLLVLIALLILYIRGLPACVPACVPPGVMAGGSRSDPSTMQRLIHRIMVPSRPPGGRQIEGGGSCFYFYAWELLSEQ